MSVLVHVLYRQNAPRLIVPTAVSLDKCASAVHLAGDNCEMWMQSLLEVQVLDCNGGGIAASS